MAFFVFFVQTVLASEPMSFILCCFSVRGQKDVLRYSALHFEILKF